MSQRIAGCCCNKDCDGTTLGTCCITTVGANPNCLGTCEGYDQFNVYQGAILDSTASDCDNYIGLVIGTNPDGSDQIIARVQFTPYNNCDQILCVCKENITCLECKRQNGKWQPALSCDIACGGSCCIKDSNGIVVRCIDVKDECQCRLAASTGQTATFTQGKNCFVTNCVAILQECKCKWWQRIETLQSSNRGAEFCPECQFPQTYYTETSDSYYQSFFVVCESDQFDYSQFDSITIDTSGGYRKTEIKYVLAGNATSILADGVQVTTKCNYEGKYRTHETRISECCPNSYDRRTEGIIPSPIGDLCCPGSCCKII